MSLIDRLKRIFKRNKNNLIDSDEIRIHPNTCKYKNMVIFSPDRHNEEHEPVNIYISAFDANAEPITNENIQIKIGNEIIERKTSENGFIAFKHHLKVGRHTAEITFPNGEYAQTIETKIRIVKEKSKSKPKKINERKVYLNASNMKMYLHNEVQYYARIRDYEYNPIIGEPINFTIDNKTYTGLTDKQGFARLDAKLPEGPHNIKVEYEGSEKYDSASTEKHCKYLLETSIRNS